MADGLQVLSAVEQAVPLTAIAATFQKNPTVIIAHPGVANARGPEGQADRHRRRQQHDVLAVAASRRYGFTDAQKRPYGFSVQPFLADANLSQQGFATSEPFSIEKAGVKPVVFLLADLGYPPYSGGAGREARSRIAARDALQRFVRASAEGWKSYLANPAPGQRAHPQGQPANERRAPRLRCAQDARVRHRRRRRPERRGCSR